MDTHSDLFETNFDHLMLIKRNSSSNSGTSLSYELNSHHLVSANSFELNGGATSSSDDSGLPLTNSSISSGDSSRVGLCRFEFELAESDGEVSQFDSLDNCSDGGMSAENFNTLKKGPLAVIDPPPEFQDSPHTTLLRSQVLQSYAQKLSKNVISNSLVTYTQISLNTEWPQALCKPTEIANGVESAFSSSRSLIKKYNHPIYASDSVLNIKIDNVYDVPNGDSYEMLDCSLYREPEIDTMAIRPELCFFSHRYYGDYTDEINRSPIYDNENNSGNYLGNRDIGGIGDATNCGHLKRKPILYSPLHHHPGSNLTTSNRPNSRNSLNSRLSSSHNSLSVPTANKADDSIFITQAMSHDALLGREISDFYNVPIDSDIYALPVDMVKPEVSIENKFAHTKSHRNRLKYIRNNKKRRKNTAGVESNVSAIDKTSIGIVHKISKSSDKRHSVPENTIEPMHMTLDEVKRFYHSLYSSSSESSDPIGKGYGVHHRKNGLALNLNNNNNINNNNINGNTIKNSVSHVPTLKNTKLTVNLKNKKLSVKDESAQNIKYSSHHTTKKPQFSINLNLKQKFCSIFRLRRPQTHHHPVNVNAQSSLVVVDNNNYALNKDSLIADGHDGCGADTTGLNDDRKVKFSMRALPPLPPGDQQEEQSFDDKLESFDCEDTEKTVTMDFATNIEKVKECGWYWGPISSEAAEKILSNEPDGSFIVRDSSDDHYIFSLTFKLNGCVRHVRIEQDQGTFSFGSCAKFKSRTIMEFIEKAVEHSRSGRYLFFLHRRPEHGPMRVQLTNPVSRFKHIQSLQHMCRFIILKTVVRKDLIRTLPLPRRILDYLSYKNCYSEQIESDSSQSQMSGDEKIT